MTTYQTVEGKPAQLSNRSCLNCHLATGNNGSYVWLDAVANRVPVLPSGSGASSRASGSAAMR